MKGEDWRDNTINNGYLREFKQNTTTHSEEYSMEAADKEAKITKKKNNELREKQKEEFNNILDKWKESTPEYGSQFEKFYKELDNKNEYLEYDRPICYDYLYKCPKKPDTKKFLHTPVEVASAIIKCMRKDYKFNNTKDLEEKINYLLDCKVKCKKKSMSGNYIISRNYIMGDIEYIFENVIEKLKKDENNLTDKNKLDLFNIINLAIAHVFIDEVNLASLKVLIKKNIEIENTPQLPLEAEKKASTERVKVLNKILKKISAHEKKIEDRKKSPEERENEELAKKFNKNRENFFTDLLKEEKIDLKKLVIGKDFFKTNLPGESEYIKTKTYEDFKRIRDKFFKEQMNENFRFDVEQIKKNVGYDIESLLNVITNAEKGKEGEKLQQWISEIEDGFYKVNFVSEVRL